jgi:aspartate ammonia-lyase
MYRIETDALGTRQVSAEALYGIHTRLPARQAGSSIMPGKVNPVIPEAVSQAAMQVMGNDIVIAQALRGRKPRTERLFAAGRRQSAGQHRPADHGL